MAWLNCTKSVVETKRKKHPVVIHHMTYLTSVRTLVISHNRHDHVKVMLIFNGRGHMFEKTAKLSLQILIPASQTSFKACEAQFPLNGFGEQLQQRHFWLWSSLAVQDIGTFQEMRDTFAQNWIHLGWPMGRTMIWAKVDDRYDWQHRQWVAKCETLYRMRWHKRYNINVFIQASRIIFERNILVWRNFEPLSRYVMLLPMQHQAPSPQALKTFIINHLGESCSMFWLKSVIYNLGVFERTSQYRDWCFWPRLEICQISSQLAKLLPMFFLCLSQ